MHLEITIPSNVFVNDLLLQRKTLLKNFSNSKISLFWQDALADAFAGIASRERATTSFGIIETRFHAQNNAWW